MIPIVYEDMTSKNLFEFVITLPITFLHREMAFTEDVLPIDLLILPKGADGNMIKSITDAMGDIVNQFARPEILKLFENYPNTFKLIDSHVGGYGKDRQDKNLASFAYYFDIGVDVGDINASTKVFNSLSEITIRIANHISDREYATIKAHNNARLYMQNIANLYEEKFIEYTTNVFDAYTAFVSKLSTYPNRIETFDDILLDDLNSVKKYAKQGFNE